MLLNEMQRDSSSSLLSCSSCSAVSNLTLSIDTSLLNASFSPSTSSLALPCTVVDASGVLPRDFRDAFESNSASRLVADAYACAKKSNKVRAQCRDREWQRGEKLKGIAQRYKPPFLAFTRECLSNHTRRTRAHGEPSTFLCSNTVRRHRWCTGALGNRKPRGEVKKTEQGRGGSHREQFIVERSPLSRVSSRGSHHTDCVLLERLVPGSHIATKHLSVPGRVPHLICGGGDVKGEGWGEW